MDETTDNSTPVDAQDNADETTPQAEQQESEPLTFDGWLAQRDPDEQQLVETHIGGLQNALQTERGDRKRLEKQLKEAIGKAEQGSEYAQQLTQIQESLAETEQRTAFYETAHAAGVRNLKLAYTAAREFGTGDDLDALKEAAPELFATPIKAPINAGAATDRQPKKAFDMNAALRAAAGVTR